MTANVIDINQVDVSKIAKDEVFAIDTNVLIWTHYSKASNAKIFFKEYHSCQNKHRKPEIDISPCDFI